MSRGVYADLTEERKERSRETSRAWKARKADAENREVQLHSAVLTLLPPLGRWIDRASCADKNIPAEWFLMPIDREDVPAEQLLTEQRKVAHLCGACPVRIDCLNEARRNRFVGTWGGVLRSIGHPEQNLIATHRVGATSTPIEESAAA